MEGIGSVGTPKGKASRSPSGKPTIQCPECGDWVLLESGVGTPPYRQYTCTHGHVFGLAHAGNGSSHADEGSVQKAKPKPKSEHER